MLNQTIYIKKECLSLFLSLTHTDADRQTDRHTHTNMHAHTHRQIDRQTDTDTHSHRHTHTQRHTDIHTHTHTHKGCPPHAYHHKHQDHFGMELSCISPVWPRRCCSYRGAVCDSKWEQSRHRQGMLPRAIHMEPRSEQCPGNMVWTVAMTHPTTLLYSAHTLT